MSQMTPEAFIDAARDVGLHVKKILGEVVNVYTSGDAEREFGTVWFKDGGCYGSFQIDFKPDETPTAVALQVLALAARE
jgi:hypothetical protein